MYIQILRDTQTIKYAAEELKKYLSIMDSEIEANIIFSPEASRCAINLGLLSDFELDDYDVTDAMIDDVVDVKIDSLSGYIAGSNDRSILMGVYNYLKSAGCRWVRPGKLGEYIPKANMSSHSFSYRKKADYPFRGQAIEGAVSYEHVRDTIYWLPKVEMNLFQIEQIVPYNYMSRWYKHTFNTKLPHDDIAYDEYCRYVSLLEQDIKKCGLQLHALGHGALNEPFGIRHLTAGLEYNVPDETKKALALLDGKREIHQKSPFYTQLCMSQEWVQEKVVNWLSDYLKEKPYIDFLHFYLSDSINNHCECDECARKTPSDWYVDMLNKLDEKLTEQGNNSKIVFIMYVDTLWPPIVSKLNNPSRFIMTTACGSGVEYSSKRREGGIPRWERNNFTVSGGLDIGLTFKDGWKPIFDGPSFIYEYKFFTEHYADPGYMNITRRVANDAKSLCVTGFNGIMSDQTQRCYFPTGLPVSILGEMLFDTSIDTEQYVDEYMAACFGADWKEAKSYLNKISESFDFKSLVQNSNVTAQDTGAIDVNFKKTGIIGNQHLGDIIATVPQIVDDFAPKVSKNSNSGDCCQRESWRILYYHGEYCKGVSKIYFALSRNDRALARNHLEELNDYLSNVEMEIHNYFDLFLFTRRTKQIIAERC